MSWRSLFSSAPAAVDLPPLLISTTFSKHAYTVHLTDLSHIWSESLDRKAIIRRSRDENTSIDPSSSSDQFSILLKKIGLGLAGGSGTTCTLTIGSEEEIPRLGLVITVDLPGGLAPLVWTMKLSSTSTATMKSHLIMPLLRTRYTQHKEIEGLCEIIRDKDHVIHKLLDKLESMGTDLGQVFAQAAGRPGRKADWHRERVKGMAVFDYEQWRQSSRKDQPQEMTELFKETFGDDKNESNIVCVPESAEDFEAEHWWRSIGGLTINLSSGKVSTIRNDKQNSKPAAVENQNAASRLDRSPATLPKASSVMDEEAFEPLPGSQKVNDEDHLDALSRGRDPQKSQSPLPVPKIKGSLGKVGGKKKAASPELPTSNASTSDAKTASEDAKPEASVAEASSKPRKKLGQIGGKKRKDTTPPDEAPIQHEPEPSSAPQTPKKKLGIVGHRKEPPISQEGEPSRGRQSIKPGSSTPPPRETSDERADRKREQLKRELGQRAKVPVKKKRKL